MVGLFQSTGLTPAEVFDEAAAARFLASLRAEVHRREFLLAPHGGEIDIWWQRVGSTGGWGGPRPAAAPLPRLVLVIDEFARLLEVTPEFLPELVRIASKGRSLGVHLVLATQSLQGTLSAELKNNVDLRICLRQNEPADSIEVVEYRCGGHPRRSGGAGAAPLRQVRHRYPGDIPDRLSGDRPGHGPATSRVRELAWQDWGQPSLPENTPSQQLPSELVSTVAAITDAADQAGFPPARQRFSHRYPGPWHSVTSRRR